MSQEKKKASRVQIQWDADTDQPAWARRPVWRCTIYWQYGYQPTRTVWGTDGQPEITCPADLEAAVRLLAGEPKEGWVRSYPTGGGRAVWIAEEDDE